jgi:hypothetical protein
VFDVPYEEQINDMGQLELLVTLGVRHQEMHIARPSTTI